MPGLHGCTLLSAPMIFALDNCFGPGFLRTACPPPYSYGSLLALSCASPLAVSHASFDANVPQPTLLVVSQSPLPAATAQCRTTAQNHKEAEETMSNKS